MCIKREKSTDMPLINNGIVKPKKILAKKPVLNKSLSLSEVIDQFVLVKGKLPPPANKTGAEEETKVQKATTGTRAFIGIWLHATSCSPVSENSKPCEDVKCKKMKMVMVHWAKCLKLSNGENCQMCRQLLRVFAEHALYLCQEGPKNPCRVPMCEIMRLKAALSGN